MFSRYSNTKSINISETNSNNQIITRRIYASSPGLSKKIRDGIKNGNIQFITKVISGGERLDTLAGIQYGNSSLWWIIAAANGIGYGMQIQEGRELIIPINLQQIIILI